MTSFAKTGKTMERKINEVGKKRDQQSGEIKKITETTLHFPL